MSQKWKDTSGHKRNEYMPQSTHYHLLKLPHCLFVTTVYNAVFWLNCLPHQGRIHPTLSPHTMVTESKINYHKHCKLQFRTYMQMHKQHYNAMLSQNIWRDSAMSDRICTGQLLLHIHQQMHHQKQLDRIAHA